MGLPGVRALIRACAFAGVVAMMVMSGGCSTLSAAPASGGFVERSVTVDGAAYRYQVFVPARAVRRDPAPTILFLHGTGLVLGIQALEAGAAQQGFHLRVAQRCLQRPHIGFVQAVLLGERGSITVDQHHRRRQRYQ